MGQLPKTKTEKEDLPGLNFHCNGKKVDSQFILQKKKGYLDKSS